MQVSFNPSVKSYNPNFKALSPVQIAEYTKSADAAAMFKTDVLRGAIKLDDADRKTLSELAIKLKSDGEIFVARILNKILNPNNPI